jgi:hypothetical protein
LNSRQRAKPRVFFKPVSVLTRANPQTGHDPLQHVTGR